MDKEDKEILQGVRKDVNKENEYYNIYVGDWNSNVDKEIEGAKLCGKFGLGDRNESGEDFMDFAVRNNMKITNSYFQKKENRRWTWASPNRNTRNEIDCKLINNLSIVKDVSVLWWTCPLS